MTTAAPAADGWTPDDLRAWRARLRWTQERAAAALCYHVEAYKRLECGTRHIAPRVRRLCLLTEREYVRSMFQIAGAGPGQQAFSTADRALERMQHLAAEGALTDRRGRPRLRYLSLCSGIAGETAALERLNAGAVIVGFCETDPAANAVLRYRWMDAPRLGDITADTDWSLLRGQVDLVVGGTPCASFSVAGRRLGIRDPRGNLSLHFLRVVATIKPQWVLYENVPGLLSSNGGDDFGVFIHTLADLGYACSWRVLDARQFSLPQRRKRLWVIAEHSGSGDRTEQILALRNGASWNPRSRRASWKTPAGHLENGAEYASDDAVDYSEASAWLSDRAAAPPPAPSSGVPAIGPIISFKPNVGAAAHGIGAEVDVAPTLGSVSGGTRVPAIAYAADMRHATVGDVSQTIQVGPHGGWSVNATPCVIHESSGELVVRRFSPLECLRLQGFDDDWLDGVKILGKPLSDSDRYRLIGNAWPVNVAAWILQRLLAVHWSS